jgi:adenine-specific DNA methylase
MNFIANETAKKLSGRYYTHPDLATFLARWALEIKPRRILEPACGDGVFFDAISRLRATGIESVIGCELHPAAAAKARAKAGTLSRSCRVEVGDFLEWALRRRIAAPEFDAVLGNPPFIRYQYLNEATQRRAGQIFKNLDLPFTKHTNAWVPFVIASLAMLRPSGRLAMVVPSELLHVLHARPLRQFLLRVCSHVLVLDPDDILFGETLQGVVLLLAQKRAKREGGEARVAITAVRGRDVLSRPARDYFQTADFFPGSVLGGKWMVGLLGTRERALIAALGSLPQIRRVIDVATVGVGLVTGANQFFLVPDSVVHEYGLHRWAHPMFGRSGHVSGVIYDARSHAENRRLGLPANFLWFGATPIAELPEGARRYIRRGESQGLAGRYKCRIRAPWYNVPSVYLAPVGMLKRCHHFPRLILNTAGAYTTDTAYRMTVKRGKPADLVASFVNSLTALSCELEGRHYGGGVLELVPSEIESVLVPAGGCPPGTLRVLDGAVRGGVPPEDLLARQDVRLLRPLGVGTADREALRAAWVRLRDRRQRTSAAGGDSADDH